MTKNNQIFGKEGEDLAVEFITKNGFKIIERNWRYSRLGEIDIIAEDQDSLVFIEVKSRRTLNQGHPLEAITQSKFNKIRKIAEIYLNGNPALMDKYNSFRFDAIGILLMGKIPEFFHYKDI